MSYQLPIQGGSGAVCQTSWIHKKVMVTIKKNPLTMSCHGSLKVRYMQ